MKKLYTIVVGLMAVLSTSAQTWNLVEMTDDEFAQGGTSVWSFEKFACSTGEYSKFTTFDEKSTVNYVDLYQPERVGGVSLLNNLEDVEISGEFTWPASEDIRKAWYDTEWTNPTRTDANNKFVYVSRLPQLDNAFELCGNQSYTATVTFTAPDDGYYRVVGSVIRQDGANLKAIEVVPRFRPAGSNQVAPTVNLGFTFPFGEGGEYIDGVTDFRLADGGEQRYTAQEASEFSFAFHAKAGDKVAMEVSYAGLTPSNWPRDYYPRSFYRELEVVSVDEATASAEENYADPYDKGVIGVIMDKLNEYFDKMQSEIHPGTAPGNAPVKDWTEFSNLLSQYYGWLDNGTINSTNGDQYLEQLEEAWQKLAESVILFDLSAEGNFRLFSYETDEEGKYVVTNNSEAMDANDDAPWGFYGRVTGTGAFEKLENHDTSNTSGKVAWYKGSNEWFYITDGGELHPLTNRAPGIMFTAIEEGVHRLDLTLYRPNPNPKLENPLYVRWFHIYGDAEVAKTEDAVLSAQYGSVANDGEGGKKPVKTALYAYLKEGDRLFFEVDCYTTNRNSSAGTQILNLTAVTHRTDEEALTEEDAKKSGLVYINPYATGDCTVLKAEVEAAEQLLTTTIAGTVPGQYPEEARTALNNVLTEARAYIEREGDPTLTQGMVDAMVVIVQKAVEDYMLARVPVILQPEGEFALQIAGTDTYLVKKNQGNGNYFYADVTNVEGIAKDIERNNTREDQYSWTYTFTPIEGTKSVNITTSEGYMSNDGYIVKTEILDDMPSFTLVKEEPDSETFAIRRDSDGKYWSNKVNWKSPYNLIETSSEPQYIWRLSTNKYTAIEKMRNSENEKTRNEAVYDLSGRRISMSSFSSVPSVLPKGLYIKNGKKFIVK